VLETGGNDAHGVSPVVVLHGASANLEDMRLALTERFGGRRQIVFIDRPGVGFSARGGKAGASPAYQAAALRDVLDRLGVAPAILVAHWADSRLLHGSARGR
jgi:pimeloyl-ACP methyl ester carboxylesterase